MSKNVISLYHFLTILLITNIFYIGSSLAKEFDIKKINIIKNLMLNRYN